jgi:hypothetical protein
LRNDHPDHSVVMRLASMVASLVSAYATSTNFIFFSMTFVF